MPNFIASPYYSAWQKRRKWKYLKFAIIANLLHLALISLGFMRLMKILQLFQPKVATSYFLSNKAECKQVKKLVNPIFKRIRRSKYLWSNCLSSSILLWYILRKQGLDTHIVIGTKKKKGTFKAHAWIEYDNFPLNEKKRIRELYNVFEYDFSKKYFLIN